LGGVSGENAVGEMARGGEGREVIYDVSSLWMERPKPARKEFIGKKQEMTIGDMPIW
jgi:hypothetical protein